MTAAFEVPAYVKANIARREAADRSRRRCVYGCDAEAHPYPGGTFCDPHSPWAVAGLPDPRTQVDSRYTADALRARMLTEQGLTPEPPAEKSPVIHRQFADNSRPATTDTIVDRWRAFHTSNPHVYARVVELVTDAVLRGETRIGVGALFERLRYSERTETNGDRYRLNNDHRAPLVRQLLDEHPEWTHLFELRERRAS